MHLKVAIQGFGNVGSNAARFLADRGCHIVAVSDVFGGILSRDRRGLAIGELIEHVASTGSVTQFPNTEPVSNEDLLKVDCDVLIPAALEGVLRADNAAGVRARIVVEAANLPTTPDADDILEGLGVAVVPDLLANAGGVIASYFEWSQNLQQTRWTEARVGRELARYLLRAYRQVASRAADERTSLRRAAYASRSNAWRVRRHCAALQAADDHQLPKIRCTATCQRRSAVVQSDRERGSAVMR